MANKFKREVTVKLGSRSFDLRPTFEAICEFEERSGTNSFTTIQGIHRGIGCSFKVMTAAFWAGIRASKEYQDNPNLAPSFADVGRMIQEVGFSTLTVDLVSFLVKGMSSDADLQRMADAAAGKAESQSTPT